jgi:hypothetical protein
MLELQHFLLVELGIMRSYHSRFDCTQRLSFKLNPPNGAYVQLVFDKKIRIQIKKEELSTETLTSLWTDKPFRTG